MESSFRLYDPNDPLAILRLRQRLEDPQVAAEPQEDLYQTGPIADEYESYVQNTPQRRAPESTDRVLAALSSALEQRPHDRFGKINEMLDRPYNQEVADYKLKGEGLRTAAGMEERRQGKRIASRDRSDSLEERKRADIERGQDRDEDRKARRETSEAALKQRETEARQRSEDQSASREDRKAARQEANDLKREMMNLRRDQFEAGKAGEGKPNNQIVSSNDEQFLVDKNTGKSTPLNLPIKETEGGRAQKTNMISLHRELKELQGEFNKSGTPTGPYLGPAAEMASNNLPFNWGSGVPGQNMRSLAKRIKAEYLTATGGKSLTKSEIQLLQPYLPDPNTPDHVFNANMQNFLKKAEEVLTTRYGMKSEEFGGVSSLEGNDDPLGIR